MGTRGREEGRTEVVAGPAVAPNRFSRSCCLLPQGLQPRRLTSLHKKQLEKAN